MMILGYLSDLIIFQVSNGSRLLLNNVMILSMRNMIKSVFVVCSVVLLGSFTVGAQDFHNTFFELNPLAVNPGLAGSFEGTIRGSGLYRDQYRSVTANPYMTLDLGIEYNLPFRPRGRDWIAAGLAMTRDGVGTLGLSRNTFRLNAAYHLALDKDARSDIALGIQAMSNSVSLSGNAINMSGSDGAVTAFMLRGFGSDSDQDLVKLRSLGMGSMEVNQDPTTSYTDYSAGLVYSSRAKSGNLFRIGAAVANVLSPNRGFITEQGPASDLDMRLSAFATMERRMGKAMTLEPALLFQNMGPSSELILHGIVGYMLPNRDTPFKIKGGLGYRFGDALAFMAGADFKDWKVGLAYDINVSGLTPASNTFGALELAVQRVFTIRKKPEVKPVIFCPRI